MSSSAAAVAAADGGEAMKSASAIVAEAVTGSHFLRIEGYSLTKGLGNGKFIRSSTFSVGGHRWCINYYPNGDGLANADWISIYLQHDDTADAVEAKARFRCSVLDEIGEPVPKFTKKGCQLDTFSAKNRCWGFTKFVERKALEESACLKDDVFRVRCDVTVIKDIRCTDATEQFVAVPPSNMHRQFGRLLQAGDGADVTFEVAGETFAAHRCVLAARSPVFMAELLGPMKEKAMGFIRVDDMEPGVFKAMLHFIYTDTMADADKREDASATAQHLLVAADRYDLERLKLMCEDKLCDCIGAGTVATMLALAEQHGCHGLKKACFDFLKTPSHLKEAMDNEGFDHLMSSCPSVIKELLANTVASSLSLTYDAAKSETMCRFFFHLSIDRSVRKAGTPS